jgi:hypothetical protein
MQAKFPILESDGWWWELCVQQLHCNRSFLFVQEMKSLSLVAGLAHAATAAIVPPAALKPSIYHDWAHKHWVEEYSYLVS